MVEDVGDLRPQLLLQLSLDVVLLIAGGRELRVGRIVGRADRDLNLGEGGDLVLAHRERRTGLRGKAGSGEDRRDEYGSNQAEMR